uniref:HTH_Tnp_ISL3 domain-containing protein n=1 Tax=Heterorhabditis bacteriophora TaxID=37862 RepID=A0A1I7WUW5_HETBA
MSHFIDRLQYYIKNSFSGQCCFPTVAHAFDIPINTQRICRSRSYGIEEIIEDMRILLGVPKYRTSKQLLYY